MSEIYFCRFPQNHKVRLEWYKACNLPEATEIVNKCAKICSQHFSRTAFSYSVLREKGKIFKKLNPTAVPTINVSYRKEEEKRPLSIDCLQSESGNSRIAAEGYHPLQDHLYTGRNISKFLYVSLL